MLDFVRNKQKSIIIKLAFGIIILSFVIGYAMLTSPGGGNGDQDADYAAIVNDDVIGFNDFQTTYSNLFQLYQNIYQDQFNPALEKQLNLADKAINSLIDQVLLRNEAEQMGLEINKREIVEAIAQIPAFQENGQFSKERYLQVLAYQRLNTEQFEEMQRTELLMQKVRDKLQEGITVTESEIEKEFRIRNDKLDLQFVRFAPTLFEPKVKVTDEAIQAYFNEHQETFRIPEKVSLRYLQFVPERYTDQVTFDHAELEKYYRRHLEQFDIPEQVKAAHILIKVLPEADEKTREKKRVFAENLLEEIRVGKDFAELARTYSDDKASAAKGGDLDYFTRGTMVPAFEQAAFNMQPGEISDLVETNFGYHIIKVEAYIEPGVKPFDEALEEIKKGLRIEKSQQLAFEKAMDAYNINRKSGNLQAAAEANGLGLKETGLFARDGVIDGIVTSQEIINAAFGLDENSLARPVITDDGVILFGLKERVASHTPELIEVKDLVTAAYRRQEAKELAEEAAEQFLNDLREGGAMTWLAKKASVEVEETGDFTRSYSPFVPRIGTSEELAEAAFDLTEDQTIIDQVYTIQNRYVVAAIKTRQPADLTKLDEAQRQELRESILSRKQNETVQKHIDTLRATATIEISPRVQTLLEKEK